MTKATNRQVKAAQKLMASYVKRNRVYAIPLEARRFVSTTGLSNTHTIRLSLLRDLDKDQMARMLVRLKKGV